ncbi:MAG: FAD-dependent oxidoreductase [Proteobacteria bacterium]|nr:FAD-dependent oxidoreductase [Pseudomonadota bacterium]
MKVVIVGGVAAGAACVARLRRLDETIEIVLVERTELVSAANCGLPYFLGRIIEHEDTLRVQTPEELRAKFNIDLRIKTEAVSIAPASKTIKLHDLTNDKTYDETYDKLVLATGASPVKPRIPGIELVHTLWSVPDAVTLREKTASAETVAVIGGGFVGLETAENLVKLGKKVTLVDAADQIMAPLDPEMATILQRHLEEHGIKILLSQGIKSFERNRDKIEIHLNDHSIDADAVVLSIGTKPNSGLAKDAGLNVTDRGFVIVDDQMKTSDPDIFAAGDIAQIKDPVFGDSTIVPLAGPAAKQGRLIADIIAGIERHYKGALNASIVKLFDIAAASVGASEKVLNKRNLNKDTDYKTVIIRQNQHVGFYPNAKPLFIKLIFAADGSKIYGAQVVGYDSVDKTIDIFATAMKFGASVESLAELDLAYAPPFSSAKAAVNMTGFAADNVIHGLVKFSDTDIHDAKILDVREDAERFAFAFPDATCIPLKSLRDRLDELNKTDKIVVFCAVGVRAYNAARILMQNGFTDVSIYPGGVQLYRILHPETPSDQDNTMTDNISKTDNTETKTAETTQAPTSLEIDCCGMQCPGPLLKVYETVKSMKDGDTLKVSASDPGFSRDIESWCRRTGNTLVDNIAENGKYSVTLKKGVSETAAVSAPQNDGKTIVVFSGDFDKVMAAFVIANGAAAMGRKVTMFFTFWGLTALRRSEYVDVKKSFIEKMFGAMLPRGVNKLSLSKMNMAGMGTLLMKKIMNDKNVNSLEDLVKKAIANGVHITACSMSMDVMGIHKEELIDGVEVVGVGTYLGQAEESNVNLFI